MKIGIPFTYNGEVGDAVVQWFRNDAPLTDGVTANGTVTGATTTDLVIDTENASEWFGTYHATVQDESGCSATTGDVVFGCELTITTQPENQNVQTGEGEAFELSLAYVGNIAEVEIQWYRNGVALSDGIFDAGDWNYSVGGSQTDTLTVADQPVEFLGQFHAVVVDPLTGCEAETDIVTVGTLKVQGHTHSSFEGTLDLDVIFDGTVGFEYFTHEEYSELAGATPTYGVTPIKFEAFGINTPLTWELISGSLPPGLSLEVTTGSECRLQGTPTTVGQSAWLLRATDSNGAFVERNCLMDVHNPRILEDKTIFESTWTGGAVMQDIMLACGSAETSLSSDLTGFYGRSLDYQELGILYRQRFNAYLHPISTPPGTGTVVIGIYGPIPSAGDKLALGSAGMYQWLNSGSGFDGSYDLVYSVFGVPPEWHDAPDPTTITEDV